ncbi:unnamed protein product [Paramecium sonneborni]|uniref:Uncharacterized protein n=1 Tax=Paramecium sonneborni TaxID=65129 RepID=A0A8S1RJW6_9CILI|nr:unnamed protein product [Paramecium sonneborni]
MINEKKQLMMGQKSQIITPSYNFYELISRLNSVYVVETNIKISLNQANDNTPAA